jgi:hypothetical protein
MTDNARNPLDSLGQIVTDMRRIALRGRDCPDDPVTYRDVAQLTEAMRALAEAVLAIQAQARLAAERQPQAPGDVMRAHLDEAFGSDR